MAVPGRPACDRGWLRLPPAVLPGLLAEAPCNVTDAEPREWTIDLCARALVSSFNRCSRKASCRASSASLKRCGAYLRRQRPVAKRHRESHQRAGTRPTHALTGLVLRHCLCSNSAISASGRRPMCKVSQNVKTLQPHSCASRTLQHRLRYDLGLHITRKVRHAQRLPWHLWFPQSSAAPSSPRQGVLSLPLPRDESVETRSQLRGALLVRPRAVCCVLLPVVLRRDPTAVCGWELKISRTFSLGQGSRTWID